MAIRAAGIVALLGASPSRLLFLSLVSCSYPPGSVAPCLDVLALPKLSPLELGSAADSSDRLAPGQFSDLTFARVISLSHRSNRSTSSRREARLWTVHRWSEEVLLKTRTMGPGPLMASLSMQPSTRFWSRRSREEVGSGYEQVEV